MNQKTIWNYLIGKGFTPEGVAGLMGNLTEKSKLNPRCTSSRYADDAYTAMVDSGKYKNFVRDGTRYGIAQWSDWKKKAALLTLAKESGKSIGDITLQLDFLISDIEKQRFVIDMLKTTNSVADASDTVLTKYMCPVDQSESAKMHMRLCSNAVYIRCMTSEDVPEEPKPKKKTRKTSKGECK